MASVDRLSAMTMNLNVKQPLTTEFLLVFGDQEKPCPSFYGKEQDKKKVREVLQQEIHCMPKWGDMKCYCQLIPKIRLSKTAKNLNKVFLTCGGSAIESRCRFFQWIHTPMYPMPGDPTPAGFEKNKLTRNLTNLACTSQILQPRELDMVATSRAKYRAVKKQQTEQAWVNQFAESTCKQNERWEAKKKSPRATKCLSLESRDCRNI